MGSAEEPVPSVGYKTYLKADMPQADVYVAAGLHPTI
jgi:hypothetical protein